MILGLPNLSGFFTTPSTGVSLTDLAKSTPITTIAPTYKSAPGGGANVGFDAGSAIGGAGQGAVVGGSVGGPIGAGIGAGIGLLSGFGKPSSTGKGSGLTDAFAAGLGSLGLPGGGKSAAPVSQTQVVDQNTSVNVSNVLGGKTFGGVTESGDFDTFQAISDVFKIRDAMSQNGQVAVASTTPAGILGEAPKDYRPLILIGAAALVALLLMRR